MCEDCSERLQRRRLRSNRTLDQRKIVSKSERLGRIVNYMAKFRSKRPVQISALDALIAFADRSFVQGQDAHQQLPGSQLDPHITRLVVAFKNAYQHYVGDRWLLWRLYRAVACISHIGNASMPGGEIRAFCELATLSHVCLMWPLWRCGRAVCADFLG